MPSARDCSESSISHKTCKKNWGVRNTFGKSFNSFQFIHFNSFISIHSFQIVHFNSFVSIHSFQSIHSFIHSFIHSNIHSFVHVISIPAFQFIRFNSFIPNHTFLHFMHFNSLLSNSPRIPISKLVPIAMSYFRNIRPGACRALPGIEGMIHFVAFFDL